MQDTEPYEVIWRKLTNFTPGRTSTCLKTPPLSSTKGFLVISVSNVNNIKYFPLSCCLWKVGLNSMQSCKCNYPDTAQQGWKTLLHQDNQTNIFLYVAASAKLLVFRRMFCFSYYFFSDCFGELSCWDVCSVSKLSQLQFHQRNMYHTA